MRDHHATVLRESFPGTGCAPGDSRTARAAFSLEGGRPRPPGIRLRAPLCRRGQERSAFTLIEVLVSTAILMVIVLVVTNLFDQASRNWNTGVDNAELNNEARAAIDLMTRELEAAVAGPIDSDQLSGATNFLFITLDENGDQLADEIQFISMMQTPDGSESHRGFRNVRYFLSPSIANTLMRDIRTTKFGGFTNEDMVFSGIGGGGGDRMAERVLKFYVDAFDDNGTLWDCPWSTNRLPAYLDIHLMMASREAYEIYSEMGGPASPLGANYLTNNARIYSTRVYFPNRNGYRN